MKNEQEWLPSKYIQKGSTLRASRNGKEVGVASRLVADKVAEFYSLNLPKFAQGRLVDLGCGKIPLYSSYRPHVTDIICVDWGNSLHPNPHLDMEANLAEALPFLNDEFDTIILSDVLEHVDNPNLLWDEMRRILAPGGHIILNVPFLYGVHEAPHDYYRYTGFALTRFAEARGLRVKTLQTIGGSAEVLADIIAKILQYVPIIGAPLASSIQAVTWWFGMTPLGRRLSEVSGQVMPLGYFMVAEKPVAG